MRTITVSTEVFAAIWANRNQGEESEDEILRRILGCKPRHAAQLIAPSSAPLDGYYDEKFDVHFPEGFEVFRRYKGTEYRARATAGRWLLLNDGQTYPSLHKLSWAVVQGRENSWTNWKYLRPDGKPAFIDELRDESKIQRRSA